MPPPSPPVFSRSGEEEICFSAHGSDQVQLATRAATWTRVLSSSRGYGRPVRAEPSAGPSRQGPAGDITPEDTRALVLAFTKPLSVCLWVSGEGFLGREEDVERRPTRPEEAKDQERVKEYPRGRRHEIQRCTLPAAPAACTCLQHQVSPEA